MSFSKKLLPIIILSILAVAYSLPVFAQKSYCWPKQACETNKGIWTETNDSKKECAQSPIKYNYCYPKEEAVDLQVPIGTFNKASSLTQYIPAVYNYLVAIVSIVAIVMIMVGGLRYLTAGGNPSAITSAKETITGAIIGLFLTLGSYTILQTINPALTTLKLPPLKMIAPDLAAQWCQNDGEFQGKFKCGVKYTPQSTPKPPINSGYCMGSACEKQGEGCFNFSFDATAPPSCIREAAGKACQKLIQLAAKCITTNMPTLTGTCYDQSRYRIYKKDIGTTFSEGRLLLKDKDNVTFSINDISVGDIVNDMIEEEKDYFDVSLCLSGKIGCQGPNKGLIDPLCKFLATPPYRPTSQFWKVF